jgi:hypothetical protein
VCWVCLGFVVIPKQQVTGIGMTINLLCIVVFIFNDKNYRLFMNIYIYLNALIINLKQEEAVING